jgi:hypothetical protein
MACKLARAARRRRAESARRQTGVELLASAELIALRLFERNLLRELGRTLLHRRSSDLFS